MKEVICEFLCQRGLMGESEIIFGDTEPDLECNVFQLGRLSNAPVK